MYRKNQIESLSGTILDELLETVEFQDFWYELEEDHQNQILLKLEEKIAEWIDEKG